MLPTVCSVILGEISSGGPPFALPLTVQAHVSGTLCVWETRRQDTGRWHTAFFTYIPRQALTRHLTFDLPGAYEFRLTILSPQGRVHSPVHPFTIKDPDHV